MVQSDVARKLQGAVSDAHSGSGDYAYYIDHTGDGESGDVFYSKNGKTFGAPYEIATRGGKSVANVDTDNARRVQSTVSYQDCADDDDEYAAMEEAGLYTKGEIPLCERFISKKERDSMSDEDFAGKGKSFPINQPSDIAAAVHSMGRAGDKNLSSNSLKARIIAIAKRKGWTKYLPKAWQGDTSSSESARPTEGALKVRESAAVDQEILTLREAGARGEYDIKLIAPGKGATAFYPAEVLKRDGPAAFPAGTKVYLNHPVRAEESEGPGNRDVTRFAGVLAKPAEWRESHPKGAGLYSTIKVFSDHASMLQEKAPFLDMSIMANGKQAREASGKFKFEGNLPVLGSLDVGESVDIVPKAGAGGLILTEAARPGSQQEVAMTKDEVLALIRESAGSAASDRIKALEARALRGDAMLAASRIMGTMSLHEAAKARVLDNVTSGTIPVKEGALDEEAFKLIVVAEAKREGEYLAGILGSGRVVGMGTGSPVQLTEADLKEQRKRDKQQRKADEELEVEEADTFGRLMGNAEAGKRAALKVVA